MALLVSFFTTVAALSSGSQLRKVCFQFKTVLFEKTFLLQWQVIEDQSVDAGLLDGLWYLFEQLLTSGEQVVQIIRFLKLHSSQLWEPRSHFSASSPSEK